MIIESSKDILYLVIAFSVLWLTIFLCWFIYYVAMIFKQTNQLIRDVRQQLEKIDKLLDTVKEKFERSSTHLSIIAEGIKQGMSFLGDRRAASTKSEIPKKKSRIHIRKK